MAFKLQHAARRRVAFDVNAVEPTARDVDDALQNPRARGVEVVERARIGVDAGVVRRRLWRVRDQADERAEKLVAAFARLYRDAGRERARRLVHPVGRRDLDDLVAIQPGDWRDLL